MTPVVTEAGAEKRQVRRLAPLLTAIRVSTAGTITLADGRRVHVEPNDWLISRDGHAVDWCAADLGEFYEIVPVNALLLSHAICQRLEKTTGLATTQTPEQLAAAVERLASISIGTVKIEFTPGQLDDLSHQAAKRGRTVEQQLRAIIERIKDEIFWRG